MVMPTTQTTPDEIIGEALDLGCVTWEELHETGPGKFEGNRGINRPLAIACHALVLNSFADESIEGVDRIDRWLLYNDSSGFVDVVEYDTVQSAQAAIRQLKIRQLKNEEE
jgi:hypothetical protein